MSTLSHDMVTVARPDAPVLAFGQVFREHAPFVLSAARRMGVRDADVDDVAQDVFVVVHRKLAAFDGRCSVRSWLFGILMRVASDYRKRAHVRREIVTAAPPETSTDPREAMAKSDARLVERALDVLDDAHRAVFVLYELEEMPMAEVAAAVGCPLFTAYTRLRTARVRVRAALGELFAEPGGAT